MMIDETWMESEVRNGGWVERKFWDDVSDMMGEEKGREGRRKVLCRTVNGQSKR